ncbi:hypothetical protein MSAN_01091900 [Mycena sanguinolenta]|uniref:Uncharacterized protein n=1 Tax=Mycena sanguinolenta TaxID=230812 RepID=A0A8H7D9Y4_9AGAR|nr:hypothetical protein MSAN_01091900 [Mycena sanguinolenta]
MFAIYLSLAGFLLTGAFGVSPGERIISVANMTTTTGGNTVRIVDISAFQWIVDPGYPTAPEFTPVNGVAALPTTAATNQDWVLVPQSSNTFTIQSAIFPEMFVSYASFGAPATTPIHSQLVLRGAANAAVFGLQTLSGGNTVNILVPAISKVISSWTTTLSDATTPITVTNAQAGSTRQTFEIIVIGK